MGETFNEGLGHGGFSAVVRTQAYIFDPFEVQPETQKITFKNQIGVVSKKAGLLIDKDCTATVQMPTAAGVGIPLVEGDSFTDPENRVWWILEAGESYRSGEVWKQSIKGTLKLN